MTYCDFQKFKSENNPPYPPTKRHRGIKNEFVEGGSTVENEEENVI